MDEAGDLGVLEASRLLARRSLSAAELTQACLARIGERDGDHSHDGDPGLGERVGAGVRGGRARSGRGRGRAARAGRRAAALRDPDRAEGPLRRRREAAHRVEPGARRGRRTATATRGRVSRRRGWSSSAISTRTSSRAAGRPTRSATRGHSSVRQVARAAARARRSRRARCRRRPARTRPARSASRPRSAARRPSSPRAVCSRSGDRAAGAELRPPGADGPHGG